MSIRTLLSTVRLRTVRIDHSIPFDPQFYRSKYPDLNALSPQELHRHYMLHGRKEGRVAILPSAGNGHSRVFALPQDFDAKVYTSLHKDLQSRGLTEIEAASHYMNHGGPEGRLYRPFNPHVYRELYFGQEKISDDSLRRHFMDVGRAEGRTASAAEYLAARGSPGASWADSIRLHEFALLNWSWAGKVDHYLDAADAMVREGISRLAPLSFDLQFDPTYYREAHPTNASLGDEELYRRWLWTDGLFTPPSPARHLKDLGLALKEYPAAFRWRDYANGRADLIDRWAALDHLVRKAVPQGVIPPVEGPESGAFLVALSQTLAAKDDQGAIRLLEASRAQAKLSSAALQWLGDCHYRLQHWHAAFECYSEVSRSPDAIVWSICNGARAALRMGRPERALKLLASGQAAFSGEQLWRATVAEVIQAEFEESWNKASNLYLAEDRKEADTIMTRAAVRSAERWSAFDPLGLPLPSHPDGRVVMLANVDLSQCTHYRVTQKAELFEVLQRPYAIFGQNQVDQFITALAGASAAIFYRLPAMPQNVRAIQIARAMNIPTFYDIDDLLFDAEFYPEPLETYGGVTDEFYAMLQMGVPLFRAAMAMCEYGIASTTDLARHMKPVVQSGIVHVLPNGLDRHNEFYLDHVPTRSRRDEDFVIFYGSGTKAHNSDFLVLAGRALIDVMHRHANVRLVIVGYLELDKSFDDLRGRITYIDWVPDLSAYWSLLAEADLNIAVLADHATTHAKSEIKWIEAAALGLPSIVSATHRYREVLHDGVDALVASNVEEWTSALERMITDPSLRTRLVSNARDKLRRLYMLKNNAVNLDALLPPVTATSASPDGKRRVLLVNLFFPPQTVGGSTRVMRDNLDFFLSNVDDSYDFSVVTSDLNAETPNLMRVEAYRGKPVFRISTPLELNMEWRPSNPNVKKIFDDILDIWKPDLVHFHCVQRLSGSVVEACRERGITYLTTLHDAFWVSDYQFLSDGEDRLRTPGEAWPLDPPPPISVGAALARRRYLQPLLHDAVALLGVSKSFTRLYQECGFDRATCVANGVPPMSITPRTRSATGRVRLAQVGSQTYFKGYHHIQAALKQSAFENLELTVIDHTRYGGPEETAIWGSTLVRFVGKTKQERMDQFYANADVLLAPSLWPESFGLVSREALACGLWVVASDRGAMGEDVTAGRNGWVVDVSTPAALIGVLADINGDPARYREPPPAPEPPLRTSDDQARDLLEIYRDAIARPRPEPKKFPSGTTMLKPKWSLEVRAEPYLVAAPANP